MTEEKGLQILKLKLITNTEYKPNVVILKTMLLVLNLNELPGVMYDNFHFGQVPLASRAKIKLGWFVMSDGFISVMGQSQRKGT